MSSELLDLPAFNVEKIRTDFPILSRKIGDKDLIYFDNAASAQKPLAVMDCMDHFYKNGYANVHRGVHKLSAEATDQFEAARTLVSKFLGTSKVNEVIFTKGATESINLVVESLGRKKIESGDCVLVTRLEHHANFVPWQNLCLFKGAHFQIAELDGDLEIDIEAFEKQLIDHKPKIVALTWMSNVLGSVTRIKTLVDMAKDHGAIVLVDATQGLVHTAKDLSALGDVDFVAFTSHKLCGPTGVGVLWGKESLLNEMDPYQFGGDMILSVEDQKTIYNELPYKFEAGTPNIAGVIGFGAALEYLSKIGREEIIRYEELISTYMLERLLEIPGLKLFGKKETQDRGAIFSFELEGVHPHDLATFLDVEGIALRAGHHCAQPLMRTLNVAATARASLAFYNTTDEIDVFVSALRKAQRYFL